MKIEQELRSRIEQKRYSKRQKESKKFTTIVQSHYDKLKQEELDLLMKNITDQGEKLAKHRSFQDLARFKRMVKQFLEKAVYSGLELSKSHHFNANHTLKTVKEIDERLIQLTNDLMEQEKSTVDLLAVIGEINGLLVNLYT